MFVCSFSTAVEVQDSPGREESCRKTSASTRIVMVVYELRCVSVLVREKSEMERWWWEKPALFFCARNSEKSLGPKSLVGCPAN